MPGISTGKLKAGIFNGSGIRPFINDLGRFIFWHIFIDSMSEVEENV